MTDNQNKWRSFANQTQKETKTEKSSIPSFPNYLYRKDEKKGDQKTEGPTGVSEPIPKVGQSLSFSEHEDIPFLHQGDHQIKDNLHGQEEQTNVFPSFRQLSSETQAQKNRRNDWNDYLYYSRSRPFTPTTVPSALKGLDLSAKDTNAISYERLVTSLRKEDSDLLLFESQEDSLLALDEIPQIARVTSSKRHRKRTKSGRVTNEKSIERPSQEQTSVQESLLQEIPTKQSEELLTQLNPLPGKQRRAMNRSLSWIMEQEKGESDLLPYQSEISKPTHSVPFLEKKQKELNKNSMEDNHE